MNLDHFASRGLKAQDEIDKIIAAHNSPARDVAGVVTSPAQAAGRHTTAAPRPSTEPDTILEKIKTSTDVAWLKAVMNSSDYQLAVRKAAQRRLGMLVRKPKL